MRTRANPLAGILGRLGLFAPVEFEGPASTAARTSLAAAARNAELALHAVRGLIWIFILLGLATWSGLPWFAVAGVGLVLGGIWLVFQRLLDGARTFTPARYALIGLDALFIQRAMATRDIASSEVGILAQLFGPLPAAPDVRIYIVPLLVLLAISGAVRLDLKIAALLTLVTTALYGWSTIAYATPPDETLVVGSLVLFAGIVGMNGTWALRQAVTRVQERALLETYLPESMSKDLTVGGSLERTGRLEEVSLLTCDIRGFTTMSEKLSPVDTVAFINAYLDVVCPAIVSVGGVIDKFMGDGVLAFFEGGGHAVRALNAARRVAALSGHVKEAKTGAPIRLGVAVHSGVVLVGTIGPRVRREYTIISDTVNTLSRLEELNKKFGSVICVSEKTLSEVPPAQRAGFSGPENVPIRGRAEGINVFYYKAADDAALAQLKATADAQKVHEAPKPAEEQKKDDGLIYWDAPKGPPGS